ncbi:MAG: transcriptional repressor [Bacillales bacterium]|nr:transcriptional repressor [Bacillales bacterium]
MRHSKKRELVKEIVVELGNHPTADVIYERARLKEKNISLGTVYRDLNFLVKSNVCHSVTLGDGLIRFDNNMLPHAHFVCTVCGEITDIKNYHLDTTELENEGYNIINESTIFKGVCPKCKN